MYSVVVALVDDKDSNVHVRVYWGAEDNTNERSFQQHIADSSGVDVDGGSLG